MKTIDISKSGFHTMHIRWKETTAQGMREFYDLAYPKGDYQSQWDSFAREIVDDSDEGRLSVSDIFHKLYSDGQDVIIEFNVVLKKYHAYHLFDIAVKLLDFFAHPSVGRHTFELSDELRNSVNLPYLPGKNLFPEKLNASMEKLKSEMMAEFEREQYRERLKSKLNQ